MNHARCRPARWKDQPGEWVCYLCGERLAAPVLRYDRDGIPEPRWPGLVPSLSLRDPRHGNLSVYGLDNRARLRGRTPRSSTGSERGDRELVRLEAAESVVFVYCPNRGCGAGQHLNAEIGLARLD